LELIRSENVRILEMKDLEIKQLEKKQKEIEERQQKIIEKYQDNISVTIMGQETLKNHIKATKHEVKLENQKYAGFLEKDKEKLRNI
jgi:hypothetical protein